MAVSDPEYRLLEDFLATPMVSNNMDINILKVGGPGEIFTGNPDELAHEYNLLALRFHPDQNKSATAQDEFIRLQELYRAAQAQLELDFWETKSSLRFGGYRARFRRKLPLQIGTMYVGDSHVVFMIEAAHRALFDNAVQTIKGFGYASDQMQKEMSRYLPTIKAQVDLPQHCVVVLEKTPDLILLRDIPRTVPEWDRHVAWIVSCLHNIRCYLEYSGLTHNNISADTCFVSPEHHSVAVLGGWWYAAKPGTKLKAVPAESYELFSPAMQASKLADYQLDRELVKALARELLGDRVGTRLLASKPAPDAFLNWARCTSSATAVKEYESWGRVLDTSYGKRKFIPLEITADQIYGAA